VPQLFAGLRLLRPTTPIMSNNKAEQIFGSHGPLYHLSPKIAFEVIDEDLYSDLRIIKDIRNKFAHPEGPYGFPDAQSYGACSRLQVVDLRPQNPSSARLMSYLVQGSPASLGHLTITCISHLKSRTVSPASSGCSRQDRLIRCLSRTLDRSGTFWRRLVEPFALPLYRLVVCAFGAHVRSRDAHTQNV